MPIDPVLSEAQLLVVDASAVVDLLLKRDAAGLDDLLLHRDRELHAPHLLDLEVTQALRRFVRSGAISEPAGSQVVSSLRMLALRRHRHLHLLRRVWQLRDVLSAYDAAYVALAEALRAPLVTRDAPLAAAGGHTAVVYLV